jgi:hypothetical protein
MSRLEPREEDDTEYVSFFAEDGSGWRIGISTTMEQATEPVTSRMRW